MSSTRLVTLFPSSRISLAALLAALAVPRSAAAQQEAEKPRPNVLLLVDTSGSMEFKTKVVDPVTGTMGPDTFPTCVPGDSTSSEKSRWIDLVEVMTGTFDNYSCWAHDRSSASFRDEFSISGVTPYDYGYTNPYHRALSNSCTYGPGVLPGSTSPYEWPDKAVNTFPIVSNEISRPSSGALSTYTGCAAFSQAGDGLLDIYKEEVRFGLMTFDARLSAGTGVSSGIADYTTGMDGNWSYYLNNTPVTGHPANCAVDMVQEVGARNAAAPPWEGRLIAFGSPSLSDNTERNRWIQEVLLSTRPYGGTPIAGQLHDAREFLWNDTSTDPLDASGTEQFGPTNDPNWRAGNCRKTIMILLTDGEPNLDLRPYCAEEPPPPETAGRCPYETPEEIVSALRLSPPTPSLAVETYVIGFALGRVTPFGSPQVSCDEVTDEQCADPNNNDGSDNAKAVQVCCTLNEIAGAGGLDETGQPRKAYFAENRAELRAIFTDILDDVSQSATRTMPVFSSAGGDSSSEGFKFYSAFNPRPDPAEASLWEGVLHRRRYVCTDDLVAEEDDLDPTRGDDFAANVNSGAGPSRHFYTVIAEGDNRNSIRPYLLTADDGLDLSDGETVFANQPSALSPLVPPTAMQVTATSCAGTATADACRDLILQHAVGLTNAAGLSRCSGSDCRLIGGIYHSTPTVVPGRPSEQLRDESYEAFVTSMAEDARPSTLYTSTVDGFLHAFNLAPFPGSTGAASREIDSRENNELWAFIPPAVLPVMQTQYPSTPAILLDGVPIIKDVVAFDDEGTMRFERRQGSAQDSGLWRTVLVQGFGKGQVNGGYFAIDITEPDRGDGSPRFLWQLTRDGDGTALFGSGGTPLITTIYMNSDTGPREVPVAVLPGGDASEASGENTEIGPFMDATLDQTRGSVRNYAPSSPARSLTIVRLDNGEVIRTFRPSTAVGPFSSDVVTTTVIPAPITGQPRAFPSLTGSVADRIFVGDREGRMWRVDVSSQDPDDWTMEVFFDAFYDGADGTVSQPVELPPVLSVNEEGELTVAFATGDQNATAAPSTMVNRVISLTEELDEDNNFVAKVNWVHSLDGGYRVTGPMVLFNSGLFYSASRPPQASSASCDFGESKIFGAHYVDSVEAASGDTTPDPESGPAHAPQFSNLTIATRTDGLIFGVNVEQEPSCAAEAEVFTGSEGFGYGTISMSTEINPGRHFLTYNVSGSNSDTATSGVDQVKDELPTVRLPVSFESFALVYE